MARSSSRLPALTERTLHPWQRWCWQCQHPLWVAYHQQRTLVTLEGSIAYRLVIRRCPNPACQAYKQPYRPEAEGALALPGSEFGLDVVALVGARRYGAHRNLPEIHQELQSRGVAICARSVTNLLYRYEELVALHLADRTRLHEALQVHGRVILALDGLQPDVGHEVLWVVRDCLSGQVLRAKSLLSAAQGELAPLLEEVAQGLPVPVAGVISDGQTSIRHAVRQALPGVPHQLCQFHYLREAARPIFEADRHAKKELKKAVRGVRPIERAIERTLEAVPASPVPAGPVPAGPVPASPVPASPVPASPVPASPVPASPVPADAEAVAALSYCQAIRSALTDDGRPPLAAPGLKLQARLSAIHDSIGRAITLTGRIPDKEKGGTKKGTGRRFRG